jgi:hypothetical protein
MGSSNENDDNFTGDINGTHRTEIVRLTMKQNYNTRIYKSLTIAAESLKIEHI